MTRPAAANASAEPAQFTYQGTPHRVLFGTGVTNALSGELARLGAKRPLLATTPGQAHRAEARLQAVTFAQHFSRATMHTPIGITEEALGELRTARADSIVTFGGGSATGLGKALAVRTGLPLIAIGTTYGGSEMTALLGEAQDGRKAIRRDCRALPSATLYDVELTLDLPPGISAASGLNAMAHAIEATYSSEANAIVTAIALDAISALHFSLPLVVATGSAPAARTVALRAACQAGLCLNAVAMGLHHKLCHTLGGAFNLPHAETHAVILSYAMAYNRPAVGDAFARIARAIGEDATLGVYRLTQRIAPAKSLRELGMPENGIEFATELVLANPYRNPQPIDADGIRALLRRAWAGEAPL